MREPHLLDVKLNKPQKTLSTTIKAECKTDISTEQTSRILSINAVPVIIKDQITDNGVDFSGKVNFFVCFENDLGEISKCECCADFAGDIKGEIPHDCRLFTDVVLEKTEADAGGVKLGVGATLTIKASFTECQTHQCISGGEDYIVNNTEVQSVKSLGIRESLYPIEEEFELDYAIESVLSQRAIAKITAVQCGVGTIIVDGEAEICQVVLQSGDNHDIIRENKVLPFRVEIECEEAMPVNFAVATVRERSLKTDVAVDTSASKSVINVALTLKFTAEAFCVNTTSIASDLFSLDSDIQLTKKCAEYVEPLETRFYERTLSTRLGEGELDAEYKLLALSGEQVEILETQNSSNGLVFSGLIYATAFLRDGENKLITRKLEAPFTLETDCILPPDCDYQIECKCFEQGCRMSGGAIELDCKLCFAIHLKQKKCLNYLAEVITLNEKPKVTNAISVYIALEGESLWSLSKRLNVSPESLVATNKDLQFPLTGKERIVIYRQS